MRNGEIMARARIPDIEREMVVCDSPHVVVLGAGASLAAFPNGDKNGKVLPLINNFIEIVGLEDILDYFGIDYKNKNIEDIFAHASGEDENKEIRNQIENKISRYFNQLELPDEATLYDKLILSLREKDIIATFNYDPFLSLAYERNMGLKRLPEIVFLHGNVNIGICKKDKVKGYANSLCMKCGKVLEDTRLIFPIAEKGYSNDEFIYQEWGILEKYLKRAYLLTLFGYSAPETDIDAKNLLLGAWEKNETKTLSQVEIIDIKDKTELISIWEDFFTRDHFHIIDDFEIAEQNYFPRRTCEAFAWASLLCDPWYDKKIPETDSLEELQHWAKSLIIEEDNLEYNNEPLKKW